MSKIYGITVGTPMPRSNFNQTDPKKADYIIGRENIATKDDLTETMFFNESELPLDTSVDVTDIVTYKPTWDELIDDFGYSATAETIPSLRVVITKGMPSQRAGDVLPLLTWSGYWPSGRVSLYFANKDYKLSLFYRYDEDTFTDITVTALLTEEASIGDIETALDGIITLQEALMVGTTNEVLDDLHEYAQNIVVGGDT